jgi:hypothetical protein
VLFAALIASISCAKQKPAPVREPLVTLEGEIRLAGADSLDQTIHLADAGGSFCTLSSPKLEYELRSLAGQGVRVMGRLLGRTPAGPELFVESYEIAHVDGRRPVIGAVVLRGGALILEDARSGAAYRLDGPLSEALRAFLGCKVWVSGPTTAGNGTAGAATLTVESYGVLVSSGDAVSLEP